jgi:phosphatidylglycerophosphate synthase
VASAVARTGITPNAISILGMLSGVAAGACFYLTGDPVGGNDSAPALPWWIAGAALVQLRLLANLFDGMVAQIQDRSSPGGELYNEIPDRVSDAFILVGFGYAAGSSPVLGWSAAVIAVFIAYLRAQMAVSGVPQQFSGPMAKAHRMALVTAAAVAAAFLPSLPIPRVALWVLLAGGIVTVVRRLARGSTILRQQIPVPPAES